ncbi:transglycosylase domain-containing protein [Oscillatoria sp. FACHB-1407]|uniref:transglycosylase domain-containing protein n=1 Tax=Oscillatoria sp. FACHB-1407 TaxID=2692847 RepID=UPI001685B130|nr:transglycosylase domain-containing protein [Oscillatoria sp. FACHB-1407]MBD2459801.1 transglycosylase domain-containing protein [Oscillatoria sp. FACHB-1407]
MTPPQTPPQPPNQPKTLLNVITQAVQTVQAKINFSKLILKPNARVPELLVQEAESPKAETYPLLGERYVLGRSSKSCDIVVRNPVVSQVHLSLTRMGGRNTPFLIKDENSTNGIYRGKRRLNTLELRHGDVLTLGPPELAASVQLRYVDPPPWYAKVFRYGLYGFTGVSALVGLWVGVQGQRFSVYPLPESVQGPVVVYARDRQTPLREPRNRAHIEMQRLSDFSPYLPQAVLASEDSRYYWHLGIDPIGILRALVTNIRGGEIREGGSTISQQLARSIFREYVGTEDSAGRKLREAVVALKLETYYSKNYLLLMYLNRVYLGNGTYGFEDAAQFYFGKSARDLSISEAATLVGILPAPNAFNPVQDYDTAVELRDRIINRMAAQGMITAQEAQRARRSRIEINPAAVEELRSTIAPYFYSYVFDELETLLGEELAQEGNFIVESTLEPRFQTTAETSLQAAIDNNGAAAGFSQGALVTLDSSTGGVLSLVGGYNFQESQFNRATQALRQPGSTFKVFAFTAAIEQGISPGRSYSCDDLEWGGQVFEGCRSRVSSMDVDTGLALSENVVALRVAQDVGLNQVVNMADRMGIQSELNPVPGLVLGQSEVTLLELTGAYGTLANNGNWNRPHAINRILDSSDCTDPNNPETCRVIYDIATDPQINVPVLDARIAGTMTDLLQGVIRNGTGRNAYLGLGEAGKTGTNNDNRDLWFVGYIPNRNIVTGIWFGNDDNTPTSGASAQAAELWGNYMGEIVR